MYVCACRHDQAAPCQNGYTALAWLQSSMKSNTSTMPEEQSVLAAASSSGISIIAIDRHVADPVLSWTEVSLNTEQVLCAFNMPFNPANPIRGLIGHELSSCSLICLDLLTLLSDVCSKPSVSTGSKEPCAKMRLLTDIHLPPGSGLIEWLGRAETAHKGDGRSVDVLLGWLASEHR